jgi:predicted nuclease of predicted toxin-antitoxin system
VADTAVRFLVDNGVSPAVADALHLAGYDAIHVRALGLAAASDERLFEMAEQDARTIISLDTDFGTLLANRRQNRPSVILFRRTSGRRPSLQISLLLANLPQLSAALREGSVVVFSDDRLRIRKLPIA